MKFFRRLAQRIRGGWRALLAAVVSGVLVFTSFPTWDIFPFAFFALVPLIWAVQAGADRAGAVRRAFGLGLLMGTVTNLGGFYWITNLLLDFGDMPMSASVALCVALAIQQGLTWAATAAAAHWAWRKGAPLWLAWPTALALAETWLPMIFPWHFGHSQYLNLPLAQSAEWGGVILISSLLALANVALFEVARGVRSQTMNKHLVGSVAALFVLVHGAGLLRLQTVEAEIASAETLRVGMVQANIGIFEKHEVSRRAAQLLRHQRLSLEAVEQGAELIVWPETAYEADNYVYTLERHGERLVQGRRLDRWATRLPPSEAPLVSTPEEDDWAGVSFEDRVAPQRGFNVPLLSGAVMWSRRTPEELENTPPRGSRPPPMQIHNAAFLLDSEGTVLGSYDKTLRMIFSEHVPGATWLWQKTGINLYQILPMAGDFYGGQPTEGFVLPREGARDVRVGIMICYEDIMPDFGRAIHSGQPDFIVNVTNDAWFGDTSEPWLHLALAIFRSIEQRTTLVRSTNSGVSAFVDPRGAIVAHTPTFEEAILVHDVPLMSATTTLFMRLGNWPAWLLPALLAVSLLRRRRS